MGSSPIDALLAWLHRLGTSLSPRLQHVVHAIRTLDRATTMGAVAGFALAILIAWRFSRPRPARSGRAPHARSPPHPSSARKRDEAGPSGTAGAGAGGGGGSGAGEVARATGASAAISQAQQRGAGRSGAGEAYREADDFGGSRGGLRKESARQEEVPQSRLAHTVRQQLNGGKRVTIQMLGVVLNQTSPEELQTGASLRPGAVEIVSEVARLADVYLMAQVHSDESEATILSALEEANLFSLPNGSPGPINREKVLFCEKDVGVASFVRQLEPDWHFEAFDSTVEQLKRFVKYILHITPAATGVVAANVVSVPSLEAYFGSPSS
ncbi:hypothetical protein CLOM_g11065 [Closterium sp. NIES-68]|nr:hypothetical protein CLOM_g11065 [Closterium sp. NIES-68]GJP60152.1 hypothetical protein CLOP_g17286 [Closterium sp. NIES-67]